MTDRERLRGPELVVSVHDVAPATFLASRWWVAALARRGVPATLLVVPGPWRGDRLTPGTAFAEWLGACERDGHELSLHGWEHTEVPDARPWRRAWARLAARGCGEFAHLDEVEARDRLRRGLDAMAAVDVAPLGFTPPGWLLSRPARRATVATGFRYVTTHRAVHDLWQGQRRRSLAISHRSGSPLEGTGALMWSTATRVAAAIGRPRLVRLAVHPADLHRPRLRDASLGAVDRLLAAGVVPRTYLDVVDGGPSVAVVEEDVGAEAP